jgi:hypothetical protein
MLSTDIAHVLYTGVASAVDRMVATPRNVHLVIECLHLALIAHKRF